jgi:hypothetical protein
VNGEAAVDPAGTGRGSIEEVDWSEFDFVDLGCSKGGSMKHCVKRFDAGRGLGLDNDPRKVAEAGELGFDAVVADITALEAEDAVRFASMMDLLEHLPDLEVVEGAIAAAAKAATDFLYIFHPSFEEEDYLTELGLRQYWWHWCGHTCHPTVADYCCILDRLGLNQYMIRYIGPVESSEHESVLPATAPIDQHAYDEAVHGTKPRLTFGRPLWRAQEIFVALRAFPPDDWSRLTEPVPDRPAAG